MNYNLFVDESCHLEHDKIPVMCIGYTKVPVAAYEELSEAFKKLKHKHRSHAEIKWNKFSSTRLPLYKYIVDFFFSNPIEFRCVLVKFKDRLNHEDFNQGSHDNFYYKLIYFLLRPNPPGVQYRVFLDIKDTRGKARLKKIEEIFQNHHRGDSPFVQFQHIRSHDNFFFEITDLFIGAIAYKTRQEMGNIDHHPARTEFINYLEERSGFHINEGTPQWESKFNIFDLQPKKKGE